MKQKLTKSEQAVINSVFESLRKITDDANRAIREREDGLEETVKMLASKYKLSAKKEWKIALDPESGELVLTEEEAEEETGE